MYSMNAIGKFISNFRDFYNEINAATLTGAIDVIVVEQPDGSYTCSPFHVRFGKLGVLRSREKVVDIEINGEQLDIHMKLGDSGEAFFVEEVAAHELGEDGFIPPHLACSPIPQDDPCLFPGEEAKLEEVLVGDNISIETRCIDQEYGSLSEVRIATLQAKQGETDEQVVPNKENISPENSAVVTEIVSQHSMPKTFCAETVDDDVKLSGKVRKISIANGEFRPISLDTESEITNFETNQQIDDNDPVEDNDGDVELTSKLTMKDSFKESSSAEGLLKRSSSSAKRKKRRKSLMKRKGGLKKGNGSSSQTEQSELSEGSKDPQRDVTSSENAEESDVVFLQNDDDKKTEEKFQIPSVTIKTTEVDTVTQPIMCSAENLVELSRIQHASTETDFHFFSDTEVTPGCTPPASRPCSPVQSDTEFEMNRQSKAVGTEDEDDDPSKAIHGQMQQSWRWGELPSPLPRSIMATQAVRSTSMKDTTEQEPISSSDEEVNKKKTEAAVAAAAEAAAQRSMLSGMFSFMKKTKRLRHNPESEGIYLSDLNADELNPEVAALYFPTSYRQGQGSVMQHGTEQSGRLRDEDDAESGNGTSLPQSPHSVEGAIGGPKSVDSDFEEPKHTIFEMKSYGEISLSLCGGLGETCGPNEDHFLQSLVTYNDLVQDPKIIENPNLVVRLNGKYYNWRTACPLVMSLVVFQKPLPQQVVDSLCNEYMPLKKGLKKDVKQSSYSSWFYWRRTSEPKKTIPGQDELSSPESEKIMEMKETSMAECLEEVKLTEEESKPPLRSLGSIEVEIDHTKDFDKQSNELKNAEISEIEMGTQTNFPRMSLTDEQKDTKEEGYSGSNSSEDSDGGHPKTQGVKLPMERRSYYEHTDKYRKTLRLSSDQIARLNLHEGGNEVVFSVTTAYQGTTRCKCHIYKWRFDDKIVISDIDGTITKSDVLGHILPIVGKDWAQSGVAQLFTKIKNNGYKLLYLSARAIGQARVTREYLKSIKQGDLSLPDGPLLLNPTSLLSAFHREVIEKKPEEFKISCLRDIQALFPEDSKPFYAGYGNRINDVWAYRAVGIPIFRIFTINHRGELKHELTQTFQSSYSNMSYIVDQMFPPPPEDTSEDFTNFIYWRDPIPEIDVELTPVTEVQSSVPGPSVPVPAVAST